jgi:hypothetical protein
VKIAVGSPKLPKPIGQINCISKNGKTNIYHNIDLGQYRRKIFNVVNGYYEDLQGLHSSFHNSG